MRTLRRNVRTSGCIEDRFEFLGRRYVQSRANPYSNKLPKVRNTLRDIECPYERISASLVASALGL